jgi:acetyl-CoA synthetase
VPKAYVILAPGFEPDRETALSIMQYTREHLAPYKRIRRIEFAELPKTISGKIRRVDPRNQENSREGRGTFEWWEDDFPELRSAP